MTTADILPPFVIGRTHTLITGAVADARAQFLKAKALLVSGGAGDDLLTALDRLGQRASFVGQPVPQIGHRWVDSQE